MKDDPKRIGLAAVGGLALLVLVYLPAQSGIPWLAPLVLVAAVAGWQLAERTGRTEDVRFGIVVAAAVLMLLSFSWTGPGTGFPWGYLSLVVATVLIYAVFTSGLSLQFGFCGLINFGHVASMALGAYALGLLTTRSDWKQAWVLPGGLHVDGFPLLGALFTAAVAGAASAALVLWAGRRAQLPRTVSDRAGVVGGTAIALATAIAMWSWATDEWLFITGALAIGVVLAILWAILMGLPTLRLRDDYLAIVTIAAAEVLRLVINNEDQWTRGAAGVQSIEFPFDRISEPLTDALGRGAGVNLSMAIVSLAAIALVAWLLHRLVTSPWGRSIRAVRDDEDAATGLGAPTVNLKMQVLALGSVVAALSGALLAWQRLNLVPKLFEPLPTFYAWTILILGGLGTIRGVIAGSFLFWTIFEAPRWLEFDIITSQRIAALQWALMGLLLMIMVLAKPEGLFGSREEMEVME